MFLERVAKKRPKPGSAVDDSMRRLRRKVRRWSTLKLFESGK
jgi:hypothetical protein